MAGVSNAFAATAFWTTGCARFGLEKLMSTDGKIIPGIVKNGVVVPQANYELPDGAHVNIVLQPAEMPQELLAELEAWQRAGDQAWQLIDQWESEQP
jgi:hypothetical protein